MPCADEHREEGCFEAEAGGVRYQVPRFCPHRGGRLDHGFINPHSKTVTCPLHRSVFSLVNGEQLAGPACGRLAVRVETAPARRANAAEPTDRTDSAAAMNAG